MPYDRQGEAIEKSGALLSPDFPPFDSFFDSDSAALFVLSRYLL